MGGPGGTAVKTQAGSDYSKRPEEYYSSTSCVNCHNPVPKNDCDPCHTGSPEPFQLRPSPCPAEMQWPSHLQTPIRNIERYPWWIHQNFLFTRMQKDAAPVVPRKLDLGLTLFMKSGATVPLSNGLELKAHEGASISFKPIPSGSGQDFSLLLENQTLFETKNVSAHLSRWYDFVIPTNLIQTLSIRDGHPIVTAAVGALNLFRSRSNPLFSEFDILDKVLPQLPVAYETKTGKTVTWKEFQDLKTTEARKYHRIEVLFEAARSGRIPGRLRLEDLYHLVRDFQESSRLAKENNVPPADFSKLSALISSISLTVALTPDEVVSPLLFMKFKDADGANAVQLDLATEGVSGIQSLKVHGDLKMEEAFLPSLANLGATDLNFSYEADAKGGSVLTLTKIQSQIKPIDYLKSDPRKLGWIELKEGTIQDGAPVKVQGLDFPSGIRLQESPVGEVKLTLNLNVDAAASLPFLGDVRVKGPLLFMGTFRKVEVETKDSKGETHKETELRLVPETTFISLNRGEIAWGNSLAPFKVGGNLMLTDMPTLKKPSLISGTPSGFWGSFTADSILYGLFDKGSLEVSLIHARGSDGLYRPLSSFKEAPQLKAALKIFEKDKSQIVGDADLTTVALGKEKTSILKIGLEHRDETGTRVIDPLIHQGLLTLLKNSAAAEPRYDLDFGAESIWIDPVGVVKPQIHFGITDHTMDNGGLDWTIHGLSISGNPWSVKRPNRGIFQGPFFVKTLPSKDQELRVRFDPIAENLDLKNIKVALDFKQIVPPGLPEMTRWKISSVDFDGHIHGNWTMDTGTFKGRGYLAFQGDKEGDLHFRGKDGRRVEGRLDPSDPDRLYEIPFLSDSTLAFERMDGIDFDRKRVKAPATLSSLVDWLALQAFGFQWNEHDRTRIRFDYIPYSMEGLMEYFQDRALSTQPGPPKGLKP